MEPECGNIAGNEFVQMVGGGWGLFTLVYRVISMSNSTKVMLC